MKRVLAISYSQSGQSTRALNSFLSGLAHNNEEISVSRLDLGDDNALRDLFRMPWSFFDFLKALPASLYPSVSASNTPSIQFHEFDLVVLAYPVWFLSPAAPVSSFLKRLPEGALDQSAVVTIATCRNMWFEAQSVLRGLIEQKGGRVVSHVALEDRGPTYATLVTTPRFFLTGKRGFESPLMMRLFPEFGVDDASFDAVEAWARGYPIGNTSDPPSYFRINTSMALAEVIGRRIFRGLLMGWPLVREKSDIAQKVYLAGAFTCIAAGIATLLPPVAIIGRLPPVRRFLTEAWARRVTSGRRGASGERARGEGHESESALDPVSTRAAADA